MITATQTGPGTVHVGWSPPNNNGSPISSYAVYRDGVVIATPTSAGYDDTGATAGTQPVYKVTATNGAGASQFSNSVQVTVTSNPPAPPVFTATAGNNQVVVTWTPPASLYPITAYRVIRNVLQPSQVITTLGPGVTSFTDTTVTNGTQYSYTVTAQNADGDSGGNAAQTVTPRTTPSVPLGLTATPGDTTASLSWSAPSSDGGAAITGYRIRRTVVSTGVTTVLPDRPATPTSFTDSGRTNNVQLSYTVSALNAAGEGPQTSGVTVTPTSSGLPNPPPDIVNGPGAFEVITFGQYEDVDRAGAKAAGFKGDSGSWAGQYRFGDGRSHFKGSSAQGGTEVEYLFQRIFEDTADAQHPAGWVTLIGWKIRDFTLGNSNKRTFTLTDNARKAEWELGHAEAAQFINYSRGRWPSGGYCDGLRFDTEQGWWGFDDPDGRQYATDAQYRAAFEAWGYAAGRGVYQNDPNCFTTVYNWNPPGGYGYEVLYHPDPISNDKVYNGQDQTTLWYGQEAFGPKHLYWLGYLKAMADFGGPGAKFMRADANYYDASFCTPERMKYDTQGTIAALSQKTWSPGGGVVVNNFTDAQWNYLSDKLDIAFFSWPGTDWRLSTVGGVTQVVSGNLSAGHITITGGGPVAGGAQRGANGFLLFHSGPSGLDFFTDYSFPLASLNASGLDVAGTGSLSGPVTFSRFAIRTSDQYKVAGEPEWRDQILMMRRYAMGRRQLAYALQGTYSYWKQYDNIRVGDINNGAALRPGFTTLQKWWQYAGTNPPGGHVPGLQACASPAPVSTTPPTITASAPVNNGDGTFTITGAAFHIDGIRCVRGYIHPNSGARTASRLVWNRHGGTPGTNFDAATQDYTLRIPGSPGQYAMITAVTVHEQEHSVRVAL